VVGSLVMGMAGAENLANPHNLMGFLDAFKAACKATCKAT
jgi:hypothetical protein